jgi:hypothetical protein
LTKEREFDILHARSHVPMMMAALARKGSGHRPKILFDIRGFMPEEFVDAGVWPKEGLVFRSVKRVEKWLMKEANGFVVLTERAGRSRLQGLRQRVTVRMTIDGRNVLCAPCRRPGA